MQQTRTTIYLVRHGETDWNIKKFMQGQTDIPLNDNGKKQARELAEQLKDIQFDLIFSSDLMRAKETAELVALQRSLAVQTSELLRERKFGPFEGKHYSEWDLAFKETWEALKKKSIQQKWQHKYHPEVESDEELYQRMNIFLREAAAGNPGKNILVVAHGGIMVYFLAHLDPKYDGAHLANTAMVKILSDGDDFEIVEAKGINLEN